MNNRTGSPMPIFLALGFTAQIPLLVLAREMQNAFQGNELSIAAIFVAGGFWTAVGAFLAYRDDRTPAHPGMDPSPMLQTRARDGFALAAVVLALALPVELLGVRLLRTLCGLGADSPAPMLELAVAALLLLAPVGLCLGSQFVYAAQAVRDPTRVYVGEAFGGAISGFLLSLFLAPTLNSFANAYFATSVSLLAAAWFLRPTGNADPAEPPELGRRHKNPHGTIRSKLFAPIFTLAVLSIVCLLRSPVTDAIAREAFWKAYAPSFTLVASGDSPQGNLAILSNAGVSSIYHSGRLVGRIPANDSLAPFVQTCLARKPHPGRVLLLDNFAGAGGLLAAILKQGAKQVDLIDIDPRLADLVQSFASPDRSRARINPRVTIRNEDARSFLRHRDRPYDVVILRVGEPETIRANRFLTVESFREIRNRLAPGGLLCILLPQRSADVAVASADHPSDAALFHSLRHLFGEVQTIPGATPGLLASVRIDSGAGAQPADTMASASAGCGLNTDERPACYYQTLFPWARNIHTAPPDGASCFDSTPVLSLCLLGVASLLVAVLVRARHGTGSLMVASNYFAMFATGLSGMTALILTLFSFQTVLGSIYEHLGLIVAFFLLGAAIGATWGRQESASNQRRTPLATQQFLFASFLFGFPHMLRVPATLETQVLQILFFGMAILLAGIFVGACYPLTIGVPSPHGRDKAGVGFYGVDRIGGCLGAGLLTLCFVPLFGFTAAGIGCAILLLISAALAWMSRRG